MPRFIRLTPHHSILLALLILSFTLNIWGINYDNFERWHPDQHTDRAAFMFYNKTVDHFFYPYGSLTFYQIIAGAIMPATALSHLFNLDPLFEKNLITATARLLTAAQATGVVLITYLAARRLYGARAALLSAAFLSVTAGLTNIAHFTTADIPSLFWFSLASLMAAYVLTSSNRRWYLLAGFYSGFAAGVRYVGGLAFLTTIVAHFLRPRADRRAYDLLNSFWAALLGFVVANPVTAFSFCNWLYGATTESLYYVVRNGTAPPVFIALLQDLAHATGRPLAILLAAGALYSLWLITQPHTRRATLLIWSMIVPYYLLVGRMHVSWIRYAVPLIPPLTIFAGRLLADLTRHQRRRQSTRTHLKNKYFPLTRGTEGVLGTIKLGTNLSTILILTYAALYTIATAHAFTHDSRRLVRDWLAVHAPTDTTVEITPYTELERHPNLNIIPRLHNNYVTEDIELLRQSKRHQVVISAVNAITSLGHRTHLCPNTAAYVPWYLHAEQRYREAADNFDVTLTGLHTRRPDYLIISSLYADRFPPTTPEGQLFNALRTNTTSYHHVATLQTNLTSWLNPPTEHANPTIDVFRYRGNVPPDKGG